MITRGPQLGALERLPRARIVGMLAEYVGVLRDGNVVILTLFCGCGAAQAGRGGTAGCQQGNGDEAEDARAVNARHHQ